VGNGSGVNFRVQNIYSQNSVCNIKRQPDREADWKLLGEFGSAMKDAVLEGDDFEGEARKEYVANRIKQIEAEFQARYN